MEHHEHEEALRKLCRVCGGPINVHRVSYSCAEHQDSLKKAFSIEVLSDTDEIHPARFCMRCSSLMKRKLKALEEGKYYMQSKQIFKWTKHDSNCNICIHFNTIKKGGQQKKSRKNRGRPAENGYYDLINHAQKISPTCFYPDNMNYTSIQVHVPTFMNIHSQDLECFICLGVLNSPIRLSCGPFVCSSCFTKSIEASQTVKCPACFNHSLVKSDILPLESLYFRLLEGISLKCTTCSQYVLLRDMNEHSCQGDHSDAVPNLPPNVAEQRLATETIRKMMHNGRLTIATGGQVN